MGLGDIFNFYQYGSDSTALYAIKLSALDATVGGFTTIVDPTSTAVWPYGAKNMRHIYGKTASGVRTKVPCAYPTNPLYQSGGSFTLRGRAYTVEGCIGEKRKLNHIG